MRYKITNEIRIFLIGVGVACVLAVLITVAVVLSGHRRPQPVVARVNLAKNLSSLDISSFQIPRSYTEVWKQEWYPSRAQEKRWTWNEVQRYWLDPRKSALKSISEENDKKLGELFKGVQ